jgi:hypothetical protein
MEFDYCISNPAFNVAEGNNVAGTGGNTTLYKTATRNDFKNRLKNKGTLTNITLKGIIPDLVNGYFKDYQVNWIHLMDNIDVWPYNTCIFSVSKTPRVSPPLILGGLAAKIYSPDPADCFNFVYYSGSNNGMNKQFGPGKKNKVVRQLPGKGRATVAYDYTDNVIAAGPKFAFYVMESRKSYTVTSESVYGGTICYVSFSTEEEAAKLKLFVEKNPVYAEYVKRMKLRGHAFGLRNMRKFDISQIETGLETPKEWGITDADLLPPTVLDNDITEDRDRVKALGEVFTPTSLVNFVLDLVEKYDSSAFTDTSNTFIDSMCGDGQFLVGIKNKGVCASKIYGIDLTQSNIDNSLRRTRGSASNIVCQDSLGSTFTNLYYDDEVKAKAKEDHLNNLFTVE